MAGTKVRPMTTVHDFTVTGIDGQPLRLADYRGKVLLVVNVASQCGLTPHYGGLEALYRSHRARGLEVLGFPCNDFGAQEPGTEQEIKTFCETQYSVSFPLFKKIKVLGPDKEPLYQHLTTQPSAPDAPGDIVWNFAKFLIGRDGQLLARFSPMVAPDAPELLAAVQAALG
jgi:glutathione peroxidase